MPNLPTGPTKIRPDSKFPDALTICDGCGIIVARDLDCCPNARRPLGPLDPRHPLVTFVREPKRRVRPPKRSLRYRWTMATERFRRSLARRIYDFGDEGW
jgi:hypothetical protein